MILIFAITFGFIGIIKVLFMINETIRDFKRLIELYEKSSDKN
jgi:hypothetical protein